MQLLSKEYLELFISSPHEAYRQLILNVNHTRNINHKNSFYHFKHNFIKNMHNITIPWKHVTHITPKHEKAKKELFVSSLNINRWKEIRISELSETLQFIIHLPYGSKPILSLT